MNNKIEIVLDNFSKVYGTEKTILAPYSKSLEGFEPIFNNLNRDNLEIVNQIQDDASLDGGDSAHRTGVLAFCNSKKDQGLLNLFESNGIMVRHPKQVPWNNWKNCSRDQLFGFISGCWRNNQNDIVKRLFREHKNRFPPYTCQNTEADYEGSTKFPPIGDPMGPHDVMYFKICKGETNEYQNFLGQFVLQLAIELASKDINVEKNQLLLQSIVCGRLNLFVQVHSNYKESLRDYWSGWRKQPEIAEAIIQVVDIELKRYSGMPKVKLIIPTDLIDDFKNISLLSITNYINDLKVNALNNEFTKGIVKEAKSLSDKISNFFHSIIHDRNNLIQKKLNELFPPILIIEQQYASIVESQIQLKSINPQIGCFVQKEKVLESLLFQINKLISGYNDPNLSINNIIPIISLEKQLIIMEFDFDIFIPKYHLTIAGKINGGSAISSENDKMSIRSALTSVVINRLYFKEKTIVGDIEIIKDVSISIENLIGNLNKKLFESPTIINFGWGETYKWKIKDLINDPNSEVVGEDIQISRFVKNGCFRIDKTGITSLIEISNSEIANNDNDKTTVKKVSPSKISKSFKKFSDSFDIVWNKIFEPITNKDLIVANLSKMEVSNILNELLHKPISVKQKFAIPDFSFDQKIEAKSSDINCQNVRGSFSYPDFSYPDFSYPSFGGWDCMKNVLIGKIEDPICVANRELARIAHDAARETARAAHDVARETARAAHDVARETARIAKQVENEAKVAACDIAKEVTGFLAIGSFHGNVSGNGNGNINFNSFNFGKDLSKININLSGEINANVQSNLNISPVDLGYIFLCFSNYTKNTNSALSINIPPQELSINVSTINDGENLNLIIKLEPIIYEASINPSPLHALLQDPVLLATCPSFVALLGLVAVPIGVSIALFLSMTGSLPNLTPEQVLLLTGTAKGGYEIKEMKIPFTPIEFKINEGDQNEVKMKSQITWNTNSIQFITFKP